MKTSDDSETLGNPQTPNNEHFENRSVTLEEVLIGISSLRVQLDQLYNTLAQLLEDISED